MASTEEPPQPEPLKYQTWALRVSIHCEGCKRKVKRILQTIDGVYTADIDLRQQKVTVTGSVEPEVVIKRLAKAGKQAEAWPEKLKPKDQEKSMEKEDKGDGAGEQPKPADDPKDKEAPRSEEGGDGADKGGGKKKGKKKKKKGGGGGGDQAKGDAEHDVVLQHPPPVAAYTVSYCVAAPAASRECFVALPAEATRAKPPPPPQQQQQQVGANGYAEYYNYCYNCASPATVMLPAAEEESYRVFSEENANACCVM